MASLRFISWTTDPLVLLLEACVAAQDDPPIWVLRGTTVIDVNDGKPFEADGLLTASGSGG